MPHRTPFASRAEGLEAVSWATAASATAPRRDGVARLGPWKTHQVVRLPAVDGAGLVLLRVVVRGGVCLSCGRWATANVHPSL